MDTPDMVNPEAHLKQALLALQRMEIDIEVLQAWSRVGQHSPIKIAELRADVLENLEIIKARVVFAANDLEAGNAPTTPTEK